ncbi:hypothetical protein [Candidatus Uabimicrobium sp. HlEnr_7]|uniref:hypothetical protein n=1 Tax=Candidatus Uabimicrobium helgolandensis TaxID=3095367 RepID=UPI003555E6A1
MKNSAINRIIKLFTDNLSKLKLDYEMTYIEEVSCLVHRNMDGFARNFHNSGHIFKLSEGITPLEVLACIFHDLAYYQVDGGLPKGVEEFLLQYVRIDDQKVYIRSKSKIPENEYFNLCLDIFDFKLEQEMSSLGGLNEFLSALIACEKLKTLLDKKQIIAIIAIIEGTRPFRPIDQDGKNCFDYLEQRLLKLKDKYKGVPEKGEVVAIVEQSLNFANKDVENFAFENSAEFLTNTWALLRESNTFLQNAKVYTITDYRQVLQKMESFMNFLRPETVFHRYRKTPTQKKYNSLIQRATRNIQIAREYLKIKVLTIGIIEAVALETGGDAPISMFLGDFPASSTDVLLRAEYYLPQASVSSKLTMDNDVLMLLEKGRAQDASFDIKHSPTSTYVYKKIGNEGVEAAYPVMTKALLGVITTKEFLKSLDKEVVVGITRACSKISISRQQALEKIISEM